MRFFNTAGPVNCDDHYCLPPLERFDLEDILLLIEQKKYFVLHAPRQTGKTSSLLALMEYLNHRGRFRCLYVNVEPAQAARENVRDAIEAILSIVASQALDLLDDSFFSSHWQKILLENGPYNALASALGQWCKNSSLPAVLLIDEVDSLVGDTLISLLRQIRAGYNNRPRRFPQSILLCGVRDVRDYRIHSDREKAVITGGSAFNIKAESLRLGDFSETDVKVLFQCHTGETGQRFEENALDTVWRYTEGQPWLVNALGYEVCFKMKENRDRSISITEEMIHTAKENLILGRETHLDQLADKLSEERVRRVIEPILSGASEPEVIPPDDLQYVQDLGLIKAAGNIRIANRIYSEIIPRELTASTQLTISEKTRWYVSKNGSLDMNRLMAGFQEFFREHSESWSRRFQYQEAGPQLLMQAYLQRIVNSGGRVEREYGLGRRRIDLFLRWPYSDGVQKVVIELKIRYKDREKTIEEGLQQTAAYMDGCGTDQGHLVIFDRDPDKPWEEKIYCREESCEGRKIMVWGM